MITKGLVISWHPSDGFLRWRANVGALDLFIKRQNWSDNKPYLHPVMATWISTSSRRPSNFHRCQSSRGRYAHTAGDTHFQAITSMPGCSMTGRKLRSRDFNRAPCLTKYALARLRDSENQFFYLLSSGCSQPKDFHLYGSYHRRQRGISCLVSRDR